ncbi:hypothetical protein GGI20_000034 [Coemansia sp. BCRC 34301]|nr:hypothetical protein GGI20_000034 [Coemansia sp. BCRC 34301]
MANVTWEPERFANLNKLLGESQELTEDSVSFDQLKKQLEQSKPDLAGLLDYPGKSTQHRDSLSKGTPTINGEKFKVSEDFIREAKRLSDFLELDEDLASTLLHNAVPYEKRFELPAGESAILLFYAERGAKLECVFRLFTGGASQATMDEGVRVVLDQYAGELLSSTLNTGDNKMLPGRILSTMDALKAQQDKISGILSGPTADVAYQRDLVEHMQTRLGEERNQLAMIMIGIIRYYQLNDKELLAVVEWLRGSSVEDAATLRMTVALMTALSTSADGSSGQEMAEMMALDKISNLERDSQLLVKLNGEIIDKPWNDDGLKGLIWLQWALLALFGMKRSPGFDQLIGFREDRVERIAEQAIQMGAYRFAVDYLLGYRVTDDLEYELSAEFLVLRRQTTKKQGCGGASEETKQYPHFTDISLELQDQITQVLEDTVSAFIERMSSLIRRMRYSEEDAIYQAQQTELQRMAQEEQRQQQQQQQLLQQSGGYRYSRPIGNSQATGSVAVVAAVEEPRRDTESLFLWIAVLYGGRPNAGLRFWGVPQQGARVELDDRLAVFLRWGSDCREQGMIRGYFNMLASLACGREASTCAFEFMSASSSTSSSSMMMSPSRTHVASNQAPLCSWSALFGALGFYAEQMRQSSGFDPIVAAAPPEIPEAEVGLLRSFLRLCRTTVRCSIVARTTLYDSAEYNPVVTMFNLLGCVVPVSLKASLLDTIAAFGELDMEALGVSEDADGVRMAVDEMARRIWTLLEQSQTLATTSDLDALRQVRPTGSEALVSRTPLRGSNGMNIGRGGGGSGMSFGRGGIVYELDEVESAVETYPQMRAFVRLISTLIHVSNSVPALSNLDRDPVLYSAASPSVPVDLGSSYRVGGIGPYVMFVLDSVLLKASQRSYRYASEKWSVYAGSLEVVEKSLGTLDLSTVTTSGSGDSVALRAIATHPGFEVAIRVLCGSKLLDALVQILNVGSDAVNTTAGDLGASIRQSVLVTLRILLRILRMQGTLLRTVVPQLVESQSSLGFPLNLPRSLTTLEQLLLTRRAAVVQVATYVSCGGHSADICLAAIKIVHILSDSAVFNGVDDRVVGRGAGMVTLNRLVSIIDSSSESVRILHGFIGCLSIDDSDDGDSGDFEESMAIAEAAKGITSGLDDQQPVAAVQSIRLAVIDLLLGNVTATKPAPTIAHYLLGFGLARPATDELADPTQRATCLHAVLDLLRGDQGAALIERRPRLAERCYRLVHRLSSDPVTGDLTLRYLRSHEDFFYTQLSSDRAAEGSRLAPIHIYAQMHARAWLWRSTALELHTLVLQDSRSRAKALGAWLAGDVEDGGVLDARMRVLALFGGLRQAYGDAVQALRRGQAAALDNDGAMDSDDDDADCGDLGVDVASCLVANERGCLVYDLHALVALLRAAMADHRPARRWNAVRRVVIGCYFDNQQRELVSAYASALCGWREMAEVLATSAWSSAELPREARTDTAFQLLRGVARVLSENDVADSRVLDALAPTLVIFADRLASEWSRAGSAELAAEPLLGVWRMVVGAALTPSATASQRLRGNVYAAMLHVLRGLRKVSDSARLSAGALSVLNESALGDRLLDAVSADAADASDAWKTVAFSLLDALAALFGAEPRMNRVAQFLARKNYFAAYVAVLVRREDHALQAVLVPDPASLNALYIYQAKMGFFLRLAQRHDGAERLLECGVIDVLADCSFLDQRPQQQQQSSFADAFIPARADRFHQLLMPALQLMLALVVRIGRDNVTLWMKAARFVSQHHAMLDAILKECAAPAHPLSLALLNEAKAVTALIFFIARQRAVLDREAAMAGSGHVGVASLRLQVLALLPKLSTSQGWAKRLLSTNEVERAQALIPVPDATDNDSESDDAILHTVLGQQASRLVDAVVQNALAYAQAVTERRVATAPAFAWSIEHSREADYTPSLATLVAFVRRSLTQIDRRRAVRDEKLRLARNDAAEMSTADLRKCVAADSSNDLTVQQMRELAAKLLTREAQAISASVTALVEAVEQALVLLWRHLSFYINTPSSNDAAVMMLSHQEREVLRSDASIALPPLLALLADLKLEQDESTNSSSASTHMSFIQMLVRRIKDLVLRDLSI